MIVSRVRSFSEVRSLLTVGIGLCTIFHFVHVVSGCAFVLMILYETYMVVPIVGKSVFASGNRFLRLNFPNFEGQLS